MSMTMKSLLKGLRYISQIFDNGDYEEQEMQIGNPTDVKHVAHIGGDGPSVNSPGWMNEFSSRPEYSSAPLSLTGKAKDKPATKWTSGGSEIQDSPVRDSPEFLKPSAGTPLPLESPTRELTDVPKQSRRQHSADFSMNSPTRDLSDSPKPTRRHQNSGLGVESPSQDPIGVARQSSRRKSKGSSSGRSARPSRSKGHGSSAYTSPFSDPGSGSGSESGLRDNSLCQTSSLKPFEEEKRHDEISK